MLRRLGIAIGLIAVFAISAAQPADAMRRVAQIFLLGGHKSTFVASCAASSTFLARTSGLSATEQSAYDAAICGLIADGNGCSAWSGSTGNFDLFYILSTKNTTTAALNLCSTSFGLTVGAGSPTFVADAPATVSGYTGDAATGFLATGFTPSTAGGNMVVNSATFGVCVANSRSAAQTWGEYGNNTSGGAHSSDFFPLYSGGTLSENQINNGTPFSAAANADGIWINSRTTSVLATLYHNGVLYGTQSTVGPVLGTDPIILLATTNNAGQQNNTGDTLGFFFSGAGLSSGQQTTVYNRLHTLMTALGQPNC